MSKRRLLAIVATAALTLPLGACTDTTEGGGDTGGPMQIPDDTSEPAPDAMPDSGDTDDTTPEDTYTPPPDTGDTGTTPPDVPDTTDAGDTQKTDPMPNCSVDSDSDGLSDCTEQNLCTDPHKNDTDGDHLSDFEELQKHQSDPCSADTDNDGVTDDTEIEFGLDPNRVCTYGSGGDCKDSNRWIIQACDEPEAEEVNFEESRRGNWSVALPGAFKNYTDVTITNPGQREAAAIYDDTTNEVSGFLLSMDTPGGQTSPTEPLKAGSGAIATEIRQLGSRQDNYEGPEFTTHDNKIAASAEYEIITSRSKSVRQLRKELLLGVAPYSNDITGLPSTAGRPHNEFKIRLVVIQRDHGSGTYSNLVSAAIAPLKKARQVDRVDFAINDLTNTTNISDASSTNRTVCREMKPGREVPKVEFYWVVDQSGSMFDEHKIIQSYAKPFVRKLQNTTLDYRIGLSSMDTREQGRLTPEKWVKSASKFHSTVTNRLLGLNCQRTGGWGCGVAESGLETARDGLYYMLGLGSQAPTPADSIRTNADVMTIFLTDEAAQGSHGAQPPKPSVFDLFKRNSRLNAFALVSKTTKGSCRPGTPAPSGKYTKVAKNNGGGSVDLCGGNLTAAFDRIIRQANIRGSRFVLGRTPISSSLRVYLNGEWVPRSESDGFDYSAEQNALAFYGSYRPEYKPQGKPDWVAVHFKTFVRRCKKTGGGNTCEKPPPSN